MADKKLVFPEEIWAGTDHSLALAIDIHESLMLGAYKESEKSEESDAPYTFSKQGEIGIVSINGPLTNKDSWLNQLFGATSYQEIRRSVMHAASDPEVKHIVLDIDSGGGAVNGCKDCADLISMVSKQLKPVTTFSGGVMASAAMWLGASAGKVYVSDSTMSGSIGVIATHMEYSKAMKDAGIGVTVLRAGKYKALANSAEPLSDKAQEQIQSRLYSAYDLFIGDMAGYRGTTVDKADATFGQGREFFGKDAVSAGLADGVITFDALISKIGKKIVDTDTKSRQTPTNFPLGQNMTRKALTEQEISALKAKGIDPEVVTAALEATETTATVKPDSINTDAALVTVLKAQLSEANEKLMTKTIALDGANAKLQTLETAQAGLVKVVSASVSTMKIGLGQSAPDTSKMSVSDLLAMQEDTEKTFKEKFAVGGLAINSKTEELNKDLKVDVEGAAFLRRVAQNRHPKK